MWVPLSPVHTLYHTNVNTNARQIEYLIERAAKVDQFGQTELDMGSYC